MGIEKWLAAVAMISMTLSGCLSQAPVIDGEDAAALDDHEAALVIERDGRLPWRTLFIESKSGARTALVMEGGGYGLGVFRLSAGAYRMVSAQVGGWNELRFTEPFEFEVRAGKLNYLGEVSFRRNDDGAVWHRFENRAGRMLTELRSRSSSLADRWAVVYVGEERDDWTNSMNSDR
jgi:hypothetical protein